MRSKVRNAAQMILKSFRTVVFVLNFCRRLGSVLIEQGFTRFLSLFSENSRKYFQTLEKKTEGKISVTLSIPTFQYFWGGGMENLKIKKKKKCAQK